MHSTINPSHNLNTEAKELLHPAICRVVGKGDREDNLNFDRLGVLMGRTVYRTVYKPFPRY